MRKAKRGSRKGILGGKGERRGIEGTEEEGNKW
jgi:hypothetical protein